MVNKFGAIAVLALPLFLCAACVSPSIPGTAADYDIPACSEAVSWQVVDLASDEYPPCNAEGGSLIYPDGHTTTVPEIHVTSTDVIATLDKPDISYTVINTGSRGLVVTKTTTTGTEWWGNPAAIKLYRKYLGDTPPS
jgi:hypothetical protein